MGSDRILTVFTDGILFDTGCRFQLSGRVRTGLYPSPFMLRCRNLSASV